MHIFKIFVCEDVLDNFCDAKYPNCTDVQKSFALNILDMMEERWNQNKDKSMQILATKIGYNFDLLDLEHEDYKQIKSIHVKKWEYTTAERDIIKGLYREVVNSFSLNKK